MYTDEWRISEETKAIGREGIAAAREELRRPVTIKAAVISNYDRYRNCVLVQTSDDEFVDVARWYTDEYEGRVPQSDVDLMVGRDIEDVRRELHQEQVRQIQNWVN